MPRDAKGSRGGKSSKTARVLSLLTSPESNEEDKSPAPQETQNPVAAAERIDDKVAQAEIRSALEQELMGLAPEPPEPEEEPLTHIPTASIELAPPNVPAPEPLDESDPELLEDLIPAPAQETATPQAPAQQPAPAQQTTAAPQAPAQQQTTTPPDPAQQQSAPLQQTKPAPYSCFNITHALVDAKVDKYMKLSGMCTCPRCRIDVIALALNNLPAKYVVATREDLNPRLSMYETRYSASVITQVMSACKKVMERPHHKR